MKYLLPAFFLATTAVQADVPQVVTDIAPVHSLVSMLLGDLGVPSLLVEGTSDPHHFQMRPSQAREITNADLVVWVGPAMSPWLDNAVDSLSTESASLPWLNDHHEDEGDDDHDADGDEHDDNAGHDHGGVDPHVWLDPVEAIEFLEVISAHLTELDPENSEVYHQNLQAAVATMTDLDAYVRSTVSAVQGTPIVTYHDSLGHFMKRYELTHAGSVTETDDQPPSAAQLSKLKNGLSDHPQVCLFNTPGGNEQLLHTVRADLASPVPFLTLWGRSWTQAQISTRS